MKHSYYFLTFILILLVPVLNAADYTWVGGDPFDAKTLSRKKNWQPIEQLESSDVRTIPEGSQVSAKTRYTFNTLGITLVLDDSTSSVFGENDKISDGSTMIVNAGAVTWKDLVIVGGHLQLNGGRLSAEKIYSTRLGSFLMTGGELDVVSLQGAVLSNYEADFTIAGGVVSAEELTLYNDNSMLLSGGEVRAKSGRNWTGLVEFTKGSTAHLTVDDFELLDFKSLFEKGRLHYDGQTNMDGKFEDFFYVNDSTIAWIPEPSTFVNVLGLFACLLLPLLRRRA